MEWWEKEQAFETKWNNGTTAKNLWKYIPEKLYDAIDDTAIDSDGYWIYLNKGWHVDSERIIHVYTIEDLKNDIRNIEKETTG